MEIVFPTPDLARREENFFNGEKIITAVEIKIRYEPLQQLLEHIDLQEVHGAEEMLRVVFSRVYKSVISRNTAYHIFDDNTGLYDDAFNACFFLSLCEFLYESKRIKGTSISKYIWEHSPTGFCQKGGPNYFDRKNNVKGSEIGDKITKEEGRLRQRRYRDLKNRPVYHESQEWSGMRWVSEHEWLLHFFMDEKYDPKRSKERYETRQQRGEIRDTYKRIRNLYSDIYKAVNFEMNEEYITNLYAAAEKFCSKLNKLKYEHYLKLGKFFLDHIKDNNPCYGIDLYKFEKELQLYRITSDVNRLLLCEDEAEAERITAMAAGMINIVFPKLYDYFSFFPEINHTQHYADTFWLFMDETVKSSRLIIDKYVEDGVFGEDWVGLFLKITNDLAETVLYDPSEINYSITPDSEREFHIYLLEPVNSLIASNAMDYFMRTGSDDDE